MILVVFFPLVAKVIQGNPEIDENKIIHILIILEKLWGMQKKNKNVKPLVENPASIKVDVKNLAHSY